MVRKKKFGGSWQTQSRLSLLRRFNHVGYQNIWPCIPTYFFSFSHFEIHLTKFETLRSIRDDPYDTLHIGAKLFLNVYSLKGFKLNIPLLIFEKNKFEKSRWMNLIFWSILNLIFWPVLSSKFKFEINKKSSSSNLILQTPFFKDRSIRGIAL